MTLNGQTARNELEKLEKELKFYRDAAEEAYKQGKKALGKEMAKEAERLEKEVKVTKKEMKDFTDVVKHLNSKTIKEMEQAAKQLEKQLKNLTRDSEEFEKKSRQYKQITERIKAMKDAYKQTSSASRQWLKSLSDVSGGLLIMGKGIKTAIALAGRFMDAYKVISNFEQANANLASILGATSDQMEVLEKAAISLGSSTRYSASQVTGLQTELAKLGFTVKEITDMSPAVLNFAGSVGTDLASAASLAGVALRSFNLGSDQTEDALGTMAVACNKSALSFEYLQNSFSTIAPVAKTYGLSLKDTIALLGTLANAGFDASSAATATRNILLNLSDTNGKLAKALGGSVHSFEDIMEAMKKLRDQGVDLNTTLELTDKRSVAAFNTFLDGAESAITLRGELEDVNGELQRMAEQRANTVEGAIDGMKSAWEGLVLSFRSSTGTFASVFKFITQGINGIRDMIDPEGSIVERTAKNYAEVFRGMGNEFISVYETQERIQKKFEELNKSIDAGGGTARYKRYAKEGLQQAYDEVMSELESQAETANAKVQELNTKFMNEEQKILKQQAKLTENGLNQSNMAAYDKLQEQLEANRKAWNQAIDDATRFKEKMDDIVSGDTTTTTSGGGTGGGPTEKELAKMKQAYSQKKQMLDAALNYEEKRLKVAWLKGEIGEADYNSLVYQMKAKHYEALLELARKYGQEDSAIRNKMLDDQIKVLEAEKKRVKEEMEEMERYNAEIGAERSAPSTGSGAAGSGNGGIADQEAYDSFQEKIWQKAADIRAAITEDSARTEYETEVMWAQKLAEQKKITAEEAERYILQAKLKYAQAAAQQVGQITEQASNFVAALKEAESAQLEAEYQRQLSAAGDNAEERERIEAEYEQKQLDLKKKYADTEMAVNIAKTIANGAVAAIKAYADAGPVAGAILAALIAATTAAEVATIIAQRNAIKNASVSSSGSTSSAPKTGERKITGYAEGGYTGKGLGTMGVTERPARPPKRGPSTGSGAAGLGDEEVVGVVHANEWVAPAWMVRRNPVMFANLEQYRQRGYAEGGYTGKGLGTMGVTERPARPPKRGPSAGSMDGGIETIVRVAVREELPSALKALRVVLVRRDLTELDAQTEKFEEQTSR